MVDAEVEEALPRYPALPAAARVVRHQFLRRRKPEVQLELLQRLPELPRVVLLGGLATLDLLSDEALRTREVGSAGSKQRRRAPPASPTLTFPLTKLATSSLFSKTDRDCSRLWSSQSQCLFTSSTAAPGAQDESGEGAPQERGGGGRASAHRWRSPSSSAIRGPAGGCGRA